MNAINRGTRKPPALSDVLQNRRWTYCSYPFAHYTARNVFKPAFYRRLDVAFQAVLARGLENRTTAGKLSRSMAGYDAYGMGFMPDEPYPFRLFFSRPWYDMLASLFDVRATGEVNCGLHHHPVGGASGWIHNDLNPVWFADYPSANGIRLSRPDLCSYTSGVVFREGLTVTQSIRAVAMLFYLGNPPWSKGDGGTTGLYSGPEDSVDAPVAEVPPINNSLLLFECTPFSYHSFISNHRHPRSSVIMWLHRSRADTVSRWGADSIVNWKKRA